MATMAQYLPMARQGLEKRTPWKAVPDDTETEGWHQGLAVMSFFERSHTSV